jgi:hypothetical protein
MTCDHKWIPVLGGSTHVGYHCETCRLAVSVCPCFMHPLGFAWGNCAWCSTRTGGVN